MKGPGFYPEEIIFSVTDTCNLKCAHCFVSRKNLKLDIEKAKKFLESCSDQIQYLGFSGGEPFFNLDFIEEITRTALQKGMMFDRIISNGLWWNKEEDLEKALKKLYDAGYDGKIGLSFDIFHKSNPQKAAVFIRSVIKTFNDEQIVDIQSVISEDAEGDIKLINELAECLKGNLECNLDKKTGKGTIILEGEGFYIPVYREPQSFQSTDERAWKSKKWFKEDFCQGPGQILFIHPNGNIAPCCGFSNENTTLILGTIDDSFDQIMKKAETNKMIEICYKTGLSKKIRKAKKQTPGKTSDQCTFCDFICRNNC